MSRYLTSDLFSSGVLMLRRNKAYYLGRSPEADICLPSKRVSRKHAKISQSDSGGHMVADLGSRNGTKVNGVPFEETGLVLKDGDLIEMGPFEFRYRHHEGDLNDLVSQALGEMTTGVEVQGLQMSPTEKGLSGTFEGDLGLVEIVQFIASGSKDGVLRVEGQDRTGGTLVFLGGEVVHAEAEGTTLDAKIFRVLKAREGSFAFQGEIGREFAECLDGEPEPILPILLEMVRKRDEAAKTGDATWFDA